MNSQLGTPNMTSRPATNLENWFPLIVSPLQLYINASRKSLDGISAGNTYWSLNTAAEVKTEEDLLAPGAEPGTIPNDLEQSTGLERLEILGKMQGVDIFDMKPLPADRVGMFYKSPKADRSQSRDWGIWD